MAEEQTVTTEEPPNQTGQPPSTSPAEGDAEESIPKLDEEAIDQLLTDEDEDDEDEGDSEKKVEVVEEPPKPVTESKPEGDAPVAEPEPAKPTEPEPTPAAEPPVEAKPAEAVPPTPTAEPIPIPTEAKPEQPAVETPPAEPPVVLSAEEQTKNYEDWRTGVEEKLATTRYVISEKEVQEMDITPEFAKLVSTHSSRVYMDAVTGAIGHITSALPQLLAAALESRDAYSVAQADFYKAWPNLNSKEHGADIARIGQAYRTLNPNVSKDTFIRDVGAQAHIALRVPTEAKAPEAPAAEPTAPETPAQPFKPAGGGGPGGGPVAPRNAFDVLTQEFDTEDAEFD